MIFPDIPVGAMIFVDANIFIYHFMPHASFGPACTALLERMENLEIQGLTSSQVMGDVAHRLMTHEASTLFGWPMQGIVHRLKRFPANVQQLSRYRQAIDEIPLFNIQILPSTGALVSRAADITRQFGLLSNDALIVSTMRDRGLTHLASLDRDFDRVPGIARYEPA